ncbi:putative U-box domain-containing protein 42 [Platanthera guangdongensis]|uniref:U-box domain-containing protein 42 n=1 Tax=Platanthera guangdongensis TaxID=2320717 RepID=A0ABR2MPU3_9ASPA
MSLVESTDIEHENFMELGCYLHRASPIIMELHTTENFAKHMTEILSSLSTNVDHIKQLVKKLSNGAKLAENTELESIVERIRATINNIGHDLHLIPPSTFRNNFTELVVQSLSRDMRNACIQISSAQSYEMDEQKQENQLIINPETQSRRSSSSSTDMPQLIDFLKRMYYRSEEDEIQSLPSLKMLAEHIEPLYESFFCPLTKKIMEDPVTIESGVTYERSAINEWLEKHNEYAEEAFCPTTGMKLHSKALSTNLALKTTIKEWTERNKAMRLRVAHMALSQAPSEAIVLDAMRDLQVLRKKGYERENMHSIGITELLIKFLDHGDRTVRCETLGLLQSLTEDDKGKVSDLFFNAKFPKIRKVIVEWKGILQNFAR